MKYRKVVIFSGHRFQVPEHIQRLDSKRTRAWLSNSVQNFPD